MFLVPTLCVGMPTHLMMRSQLSKSTAIHTNTRLNKNKSA